MDKQRLGAPLEAGLGVLAHITSLPGAKPGEPGVIGPAAYSFVDLLAEAGVRYWQILPLNPTDGCGSPYAGASAFAGNENLISDADSPLEPPEPSGPLEPPEPSGSPDQPNPPDLDAYEAFCARESDWLDPYAAFMAYRETVGKEMTWQEWPSAYRCFDSAAVAADPRMRDAAERCRQSQYLFEVRWRALRAYANARGVRILGDMPMYVNGDSADVWAHPELFQVDDQGRSRAVAGCPPDAFAPEGQLWNNPVYDWEALRESGYAWWLRRLERAFDLYDYVRLDHFIGFARYFSIPAGQPAAAGSYVAGPGLELFQAAFDAFGPLPLVAEDLGIITQEVRDLLDACGFPGMDVLQFASSGDPLAWWEPAPGKIAYSGTHDNQTLAGYCASRYPGCDVVSTARVLLEKAVSSAAPICIVPLQDVLGLGDEARMNTPGTVGGNWTWQTDARSLEGALGLLRELAQMRARIR